MAAGEMKALLEVGGFDMVGGVEMTTTQVHIDVTNVTSEKEVFQVNLTG